jgi:hypothetical protein
VTGHGQDGGGRFPVGKDNFFLPPPHTHLRCFQSSVQSLAVFFKVKELAAWSWLITYILYIDKNVWVYTFTPVSEENTNRLIAANRSYFGLQSHFKSQLLSRKTKILIHKTLVRPLLTYAAESWTMTKKDARRPSIFGRKILRWIYGSIWEKGQW